LDNNEDGVNDTNDWIYIDENFEPQILVLNKITNNILNMVSNLSEMTNIKIDKENILLDFILNPESNKIKILILKTKSILDNISNFVGNDIGSIVRTLPRISTNFENSLKKSFYSIDLIYTKIKTPDAKQMISNISYFLSNNVIGQMSNVNTLFNGFKTNFDNIESNVNLFVDYFNSPAKYANQKIETIFGSNPIQDFISNQLSTNTYYLKLSNLSVLDIATNNNLSFTNLFGVQDKSQIDDRISNLFVNAGLTNLNTVKEEANNIGVKINTVNDVANYITNRFSDTRDNYVDILTTLSNILK